MQSESKIWPFVSFNAETARYYEQQKANRILRGDQIGVALEGDSKKTTPDDARWKR